MNGNLKQNIYVRSAIIQLKNKIKAWDINILTSIKPIGNINQTSIDFILKYWSISIDTFKANLISDIDARINLYKTYHDPSDNENIEYYLTMIVKITNNIDWKKIQCSPIFGQVIKI